MSAFVLLAGQALLLLALFCARPAGAAAIRARLLLQAALLLVLLLARLAAGETALVPACLVAVLLELILLYSRAGRWQDPAGSPIPPASSWSSLWPMAACVAAIWLAFRLLPAGALAAISLAIVLCGLVAALAARDDRGRWAGLLQCGHGVLLVVAVVPGPGWPGLLLALPLQGAALLVLCRRPVWSDASGSGAD